MLNQRQSENPVMFQRSILATAGAACLAAPAFAHHVTKTLSYARGPEVVESVTYFNRFDNRGVPAYLLANDEHFDSYALVDGTSIVIADGLGNTQTALVTAAMFPDIGHATIDEIVEALAPQVTIANVGEQNGFLLVEGLAGGSTGHVGVSAGAGNLLAQLNLPATTVVGEADIPLLLSHFEEGANPPDYAGHPYRIFASTTAGTSLIGGRQIPIRFDRTTRHVARLTQLGALPAFAGHLSATEDARAAFRAEAIPALFGANPPTQIYFAYAIYSMDGSQVLFTSNRFTVNLVN